MRVYEFSEAGQERAMMLGLDELAKRIYDEERFDPLVEPLIDEFYYKSSYRDDDEVETAGEKSLENTYGLLCSNPDELRHFLSALTLEQNSGWHYFTGREVEQERLFTVPEIMPHVPLDHKVDTLVLSGALGFHYSKRHALRSVLTDSGYESAGFKSRVDAAAFAGAYILSSLHKMEDKLRPSEDEPSFTVREGNIKRDMTVGGSFHGDFRITETVSIVQGALAPNGRTVEFAPVKTQGVAGYHSTEPHIVTSMLEACYIGSGPERTNELVETFWQVLYDFSRNVESTEPAIIMFGDYGDGDMRFVNHRLEHMREDKEYLNALRQKDGFALYAAPYSPQSKTLFEIVCTEQGIAFRNREEAGKMGASIEVAEADYPKLFATLLGQAAQGLGRSSVGQYVELLETISEMLSPDTNKERLPRLQRQS